MGLWVPTRYGDKMHIVYSTLVEYQPDVKRRQLPLIFRLILYILSCLQDPTNNFETTNLKFHEFCLFFCYCFSCQKQSDWLEYGWKFRIHSFRIKSWIRGVRNLYLESFRIYEIRVLLFFILWIKATRLKTTKIIIKKMNVSKPQRFMTFIRLCPI